MPQLVETEEEAIKRAEAFFEESEAKRKIRDKKYFEEKGWGLPPDRIYTLNKINQDSQAWYLSYWIALSDEGSIDPAVITISVNRLTGEVKLW